jgi:hypothetical protein
MSPSGHHAFAPRPEEALQEAPKAAFSEKYTFWFSSRLLGLGKSPFWLSSRPPGLGKGSKSNKHREKVKKKPKTSK